MTDLRKYARGKPCMVRIPGVCNGNPETTVLAHLNGGGMGLKQPDILGAWACSDCHDLIDRRVILPGTDTHAGRMYVNLCHWEGIGRTIQQLIKDEVIHW